MRFIHASIVFGFLHSAAAVAPHSCALNDLQTIANYDVSALTYPLSGSCIESMITTLEIGTSVHCGPCDQDNLSGDACEFCYARSAIAAVSGEALPLMITDSSCTSVEMTLIVTQPCWITGSSLSSCPVSVSNSNTQLSVSETCVSCAKRAFDNHTKDCETPCGKDMTDPDNIALCQSCTQAQYLSAATYCLTTKTSSAFASFGGLMISSLLMVVMIVFGH